MEEGTSVPGPLLRVWGTCVHGRVQAGCWTVIDMLTTWCAGNDVFGWALRCLGVRLAQSAWLCAWRDMLVCMQGAGAGHPHMAAYNRLSSPASAHNHADPFGESAVW